MSAFAYKGRTGRGELVTGRLEADTAEAVANQLFNTGITPIDINPAPVGEIGAGAFKRLFGRERPRADDLILFTRQMYSLSKAGVPLVRALHGLAASTRNLVLKDTVQEVVEALESGRELAAALAQHPKVFSAVYVNIVRVGENSGNLQDAFLRLYHYLNFDKETRHRIRSAFRYPVIVVSFVAVAIAVLTIFVIPKFANLFGHFHIALPWPTRVILAVSGFAIRDWPIVLALLIAVVIGARLYLGTDMGRYRWDKVKLKVPLIGSIVLRASLARFARGFAMSYRAGVPLIRTLTLCAQATGNRYLSERIQEMRNGVERGESLSRTAAATGIFPPLVLQMLIVGEETGAMDDMFDEAGDFYEREVDYELQNLSAALEPVLIVILGAMVLVLALGVFLPMWDITKLAHQ